MATKITAKPFNIDDLDKYIENSTEDLLNVGIDLSKDKDHTALTVIRAEKDVIRVLSTLYDEDAKIMYNLLKGRGPSVEEIISQLIKHYTLEQLAIISGKIRQHVLSTAGSKLTVAYLENGTLLRSASNYEN